MIHLQKKYAALVAAAILLSLIDNQRVRAASFALNGRWSYSESNADDSEVFGQKYSATYNATTSPTDLVHVTGSLRYTLGDTDGRTVQNLSPTLSLANSNDLYSFTVNGTYNYLKADGREDTQRWNWSSNLGSRWSDTLWPALNVFYGQEGKSSDSRGTNYELSDSASFDINWLYIPNLSVGYRYSWFRNNIRYTGAEATSTSQAATLNYAKTFWGNRLRTNFSQNYVQTDSEYSAPSREEGFAYIPVTVSQASYEVTDDPFIGSLTNDASFLLTNQDQPPATVIIDPADPFTNLGIKIDFRQVDLIYLKTLDNIELYATNYHWNIYTSDDGINWELDEVHNEFFYNTLEQRFEFEFEALEQRYIKLVADTSLLLPSQITAIETLEVFEKIAGEEEIITSENDRTSAQTNFGLTFRPVATLRMSYNFNYDRSDGSRQPLNEQFNNNASVSWSPLTAFYTRLNVSESRSKVEESADEINRAYSLSFGYRPLTTLSFHLSLRRTENLEADDLISARNIYTFNTAARLYDDLSSSLSLSYSTVEEGKGNDVFSANFSINAKLNPHMATSFRQTYDRNVETGVQSHASLASLAWRLSDLMSSSVSGSVNWGDESETRTVLSMLLNIAPSSKTRFSFNYSFANAGDTDSHVIGGRWSWHINRFFNFSMTGDYTVSGDENPWRIGTFLNYSFNNLR